MQTHILFIGNVAAHLVALMSGIASFVIAAIEAVRKQPLIARCFWVAGGLCLLAAFDQAWQDEHRNTQVVAAEKAAEQGEKNSCLADYRVGQAYLVGLHGMNDAQRKTMDQQQTALAGQQGAINSCVVSLGKMNPIVRQKISVIMDPFATMDVQGHIDPQGFVVKKQVTELFILTNVEEKKFSGVLECYRPFTISAGPFINSESRLVTIGTPPPIAKSDKSYEIRVEQSSLTWNSSHPAFLRVVSDAPNPGSCTFTQTE